MFKRTKLATKDLGQRIKTFTKHQIFFHFVRNITYLAYYGIFAYMIFGVLGDNKVQTGYKLSFAGVVILLVVLLALFFRLVAKIHSMEKGYLKILLGGGLYATILYSFGFLSKMIGKLEINIGHFFTLLFWMVVVKTILLLVDEFVYTGFRLADEEESEE